MMKKGYLKSTEDLQAPVPPEVWVPPELSDTEVYHVFISASSTDHMWTQSLIEMLEDRGLKVCFHERDFTPGRTILENMSECITQSQKVLLVLSEDFLRSRWCLLEANMSLFRDCLQRKPIVPVLLQPDLSIPLHLCHLTYLEAGHPHFTQPLLKVLCTPNHQLQGSTVVPYQPPSIYNGKTLQPLIATNEEELTRYDCGVWSDMEVPEQLRLIIQEPQRYLQAIGIINTVNKEKVRYRTVCMRSVIFTGLITLALIVLLLLFGSIYGVFVKVTPPGDKALYIFLIPVGIWFLKKLAYFRMAEAKRIVGELQKAIGRANTLLFQDNILMGTQSNSKIYLVYVSLDDCRRELRLRPRVWLGERVWEELWEGLCERMWVKGGGKEEAKNLFNEALLRYSSDYTCCLAKKQFPFQIPSEPGHLEGGVCFCQYISKQLDREEAKRMGRWYQCKELVSPIC